jgi:hypothetical protein
VVYFRSLERNVGLPFAFFLREEEEEKAAVMEMRFRSRLSINNHAVYFLLLLLVRSSACSVWVCVCGAVWSIRWNDDGRRGGGGAVYLFPLNSNLNDWWELIAWQWERDETRPLLPLNIVAGSPISGDPPLLSFTTLNHRVPPPPLSYMFSLNSWSSLSWGPEPRY